ncbi:hypothetical protein M407DRAFT_247238 [Tulasnella calospora MUT 4182]|uniref:Uncharacterized protein n=1 Tax=Tulasnella calospora MUT 4182 TaxID=1051891 RepID=A0A0C3PZR0_9AGAM|nr:hypothetical protein M407DRAFT_247238 [Tulasnella calospora MUT 4182]
MFSVDKEKNELYDCPKRWWNTRHERSTLQMVVKTGGRRKPSQKRNDTEAVAWDEHE